MNFSFEYRLAHDKKHLVARAIEIADEQERLKLFQVRHDELQSLRKQSGCLTNEQQSEFARLLMVDIFFGKSKIGTLQECINYTLARIAGYEAAIKGLPMPAAYRESYGDADIRTLINPGWGRYDKIEVCH